MSCLARVASIVLSVLCVTAAWSAESSRFAQTLSRSNYVHWIDLYDANNRKIDPADPNALPYSPLKTCGRCHDYEAMAHGYHFNAVNKDVDPGRPGEPWIWTDSRTGTQIPLSYRGWKGTYHPHELGISPRQFVLQFGRQLPGGGPGEPEIEPAAEPASDPPAEQPAQAPTEAPAATTGEAAAATGEAAAATGEVARWKLSGQLNIDCMFCHAGDGSYSPEAWWEQIRNENFAWAPTAALGLGDVDGRVASLPEGFDPEKADPASRDKLPRTTYANVRSDAEKKVFFDVVRRPPNSACYYCHTTRLADETAAPEWTHDEDVHLRAGMSCVDCHRNGMEHHTVRGFEGELYPTGQSVADFSCRGCHLGEGDEGGRLGAPRPLHKGLPPLHLEKISCTACHSGPRPSEQALQIQTAMAHGLGLPSHDYSAGMAPGLVAPVMQREGNVLYPHKLVWPAFWGSLKGDKITPLNPEVVQDAVRKAIRVKTGSSLVETFLEAKLASDDKKQVLGEERAKVPEAELTEGERAKLAELAKTKGLETWRAKLAEGLAAIKAAAGDEAAVPVYVSAGRAFRLNQAGQVEQFPHEAASPYAWKLAHDVRPARWSSGVKGCYECHAAGSPLLEGQVTALGPAPEEKPLTQDMYHFTGYDKLKMDAWNASFQGRTAFKYFGFAATGVVGLFLLSYLVAGVIGLTGAWRRKND